MPFYIYQIRQSRRVGEHHVPKHSVATIASRDQKSRPALSQRTAATSPKSMLRVGQMAQFDHPRWTAQHDAELRKLASNGWTPEQIAKRMRRTPESITDRAKTLHVDFARELQNSWRRGARPAGANED